MTSSGATSAGTAPAEWREHGGDPYLELRGVGHRYGTGARAVEALADVSLAVRRGEFVAVMGPSGSGKSTLIHVAAGLVRPTAGQVLVGGHVVGSGDRGAWARVRRTCLGVVFQRLNLVPTLTARENVMVPLILDGRSRRDAELAAGAALEAAGLDVGDSRYPAGMSGGEQQRVAIARALVGGRAGLLADEPTGAVDTVTADRIVSLLVERARGGAAVVMVTHDSRLAAWADRVVHLRDGRIREPERPSEVPHG